MLNSLPLGQKIHVTEVQASLDQFRRIKAQDIINNEREEEYHNISLREKPSKLLSLVIPHIKLKTWIQQEFYPRYYLGSSNKPRRDTMDKILTNLFNCFEINYVLAVDSRKLKQTEKKFIEFLCFMGLLNMQLGSEMSKKVTRIEAIGDLRRDFELIGVGRPSLRFTTSLFADRKTQETSPITAIAIYNKEKKKYLKFKATDKRNLKIRDKYRKLEQDIMSVNAFNITHKIIAKKNNKYIYVDPNMQAHYINKLGHDGRLYSNRLAGLQQLTKEERKTLTIDAERCSESDYSSFHLRRLYHEKGINIKGDAYKPEDIYNLIREEQLKTLQEAQSQTSSPKIRYKSKWNKLSKPKQELFRSAVKLVCNIIINATDVISAQRATHKSLIDEGLAAVYSLLPKEKPVVKLVQAVMKVHNAVEDSFCSGKGVYIHEQDAEIYLKTALRLQEKGIAALNMHDAIIHQTKHTSTVLQAMNKVYTEIFHFAPEIKTEDNPVVENPADIIGKYLHPENKTEQSNIERIIQEHSSAINKRGEVCCININSSGITFYCIKKKELIDDLLKTNKGKRITA